MFASRMPLAEIEMLRRQMIAESFGESDEEWKNEFLPGTAGCHELLDRTALIADMVERHVTMHSASLANPVWFQMAWQAAETLRELYQRVGAEHLTAENNGSSG